MTLTDPQRNAVIVLRACRHYADGWGILVTDKGSHEQDGQAWIQFRTGLSLVRKGLAEYDEQFGRIRLLQASARGDGPNPHLEPDGSTFWKE